MKRRIAFGAALLILFTALTGCGNFNNLNIGGVTRAPSLDVIISMPEQRVQAAWSTHGWTWIGGAVEADYDHPLCLNDYSEITLRLESESAEMKLRFGDHYPPQSVSVQRWNAKYVGTRDAEVWESSEPVAVNKNKIQINDDGNNYIYEVHAGWSKGKLRGNGYSYYVFRVDSVDFEPLPEFSLRAAPSLEVVLTAKNLPKQRVKAAQLTTNWMYIEEDGNEKGILSDSPSPLQLRDYDERTLRLESTDAEIELRFSDDYPPQFLFVQRWDARYMWMEKYPDGESVAVNENRIQVSDDGCDYIYEVHAGWPEGNPQGRGGSQYAFRIDSAGD